MSQLRPDLVDTDKPAPHGVTAYVAIYNAVKGEHWGLIHGKTHDGIGHHCAVGCYFSAVNRDSALPNSVIDEVATINDSCRGFTPKQRRTSVLRWLRWKLDAMGYKMPGQPPKKK